MQASELLELFNMNTRNFLYWFRVIAKAQELS